MINTINTNKTLMMLEKLNFTNVKRFTDEVWENCTILKEMITEAEDYNINLKDIINSSSLFELQAYTDDSMVITSSFDAFNTVQVQYKLYNIDKFTYISNDAKLIILDNSKINVYEISLLDIKKMSKN